MAALQSDICVLNLQSLGISPIILKRTESPKVVAFTPPRPFPKRIFTPDSKLPAFERVSLILSGGLTPRKQTLIKNTPKEAARKIVSFLIERGILSVPVTKGQAKTKETGCQSTKS